MPKGFDRIGESVQKVIAIGTLRGSERTPQEGGG